MMEWIDVNDRLPDKGVSVLVFDGIDFIWIMERDEIGHFACPQEGWSMGVDVTHWMPLPPLPVI